MCYTSTATNNKLPLQHKGVDATKTNATILGLNPHIPKEVAPLPREHVLDVLASFF